MFFIDLSFLFVTKIKSKRIGKAFNFLIFTEIVLAGTENKQIPDRN